MKISDSRQPESKLAFDDIRVGDVLTFPFEDGTWRHKTFMVRWSLDNYDKKPEQIDSYSLVSLSGKPDDPNGAGQAYKLGRWMMEGKGGKRGPFIPVRRNATLTLEEEY